MTTRPARRPVAITAAALVVLAGILVPGAAHAATNDATLQGTVVGSDGAPLRELISVIQPNGDVVGGAMTDASGRYSVAVPSAPDYRVEAQYYGTGNYVAEVYSGGSFALASAAAVPVAGTTDLDLTVPIGAALTGTLTGVDRPLRTGQVTPSWDYGRNTGAPIVPAPGRFSFDPATQTYRLDRLPPATWSFSFGSGDYDNAMLYAFTARPHITLTSGQETEVDVTLLRTASISGVVHLPDGSPAPGAVVDGWIDPQPYPGGTISQSTLATGTDATGSFTLNDVTPGTYSICAYAPADQLYATSRCQLQRKPYAFDTTTTIAPNQVVTGWSETLAPAGAVTGRLLRDAGDGSAPTALSGASISLVSAVDGVVDTSRTTTSNADGTFTLGQIPAGTYLLRVTDSDGLHGYWPDAPAIDLAEPVTVTDGVTTQLGTGTFSAGIATERISGADRFGTAVAVSQELFPGTHPDVPVEYVASGTNYADALSAGPAAGAQGGGLLLVAKDSVPASVATELQRLQPERIVIVGGPAAISDAVAKQIASITGTTPNRLFGATRYETSLAIDTDAFSGADAPDEVMLATGRSFPDALAAGPAAVHLGAPILLVDGVSPLSAAQDAFLSGVSSVDLVGGTSAISSTVESGVAQAHPTTAVTRLGGADRYATSTVINRYAFSSSDRAYLATGTGFADALAGGPLAGADDAPLYLTTNSCVPGVVLDDLGRVDPNVVTLLGGPAVISDDVLNDLPDCD